MARLVPDADGTCQRKMPSPRTLARMVVNLLVLLVMVVPWRHHGVNAQDFSQPFQPLLGSCLDQTWVDTMQTRLGINATSRDEWGRLEYPSLHAARPRPRYRVNDPRTASANAYDASCMDPDTGFQGFNTQFDANGTLISSGTADGTLIIEVNPWPSQILSSLVFGILASEIAGFPVGFYFASDVYGVTKRMSSAPLGLCAPTHFNVEVWTDSIEDRLAIYANESFRAGSNGYRGTSAVYTTKELIAAGLNTSDRSELFMADFWRDYKVSETLIHKLDVSRFFDSKYYDPNDTACCLDGEWGCQHGCSKSYACTLREEQGESCLVVVLMDPHSDQACIYFPAALSNLEIPAYFCFVGQRRTEEYALEMQATHQPVLFYHWEPDVFHFKHAQLFSRVLLPRFDSERYSLATGNFGENGYGKPSDNPVDVDYPYLSLQKYASTLVTENEMLQFLVSQFTLDDQDMNTLMKKYVAKMTDARYTSPQEPTMYFDSACDWVRNNYNSWKLWLKRVPLCDMLLHVQHSIHGCNNSSVAETDQRGVRVIEFSWKHANPQDPSLPDECDGGMQTLPSPLRTSRSCKYLTENVAVWLTWLTKKPPCDRSFYDFTVSECDHMGLRTIRFFWRLPDAANASLSEECQDSDPSTLPAPMEVGCEYLPTSHGFFSVICSFSAIVALLYLVAIKLVWQFRAESVIKRSQYEVLIQMLVGGIAMSGTSVIYAGRPTIVVCAFRPVLACFAFTTVFGALVLKSLWLYVVDALLLLAWGILDFPFPRSSLVQVAGLAEGTIEQFNCQSNSMLFSALLIFWKVLLLLLGGAFAFMIRKVPSDFQESFWIFCSILVVLAVSFVVLPMAYLVQMAATTLYLFIAGSFLFATLVVVLLMLLPKAIALRNGRTIVSSARVTSSPSIPPESIMPDSSSSQGRHPHASQIAPDSSTSSGHQGAPTPPMVLNRGPSVVDKAHACFK